MEEPRREHRARVAGRHDRVGPAVGDCRAPRATSVESGFARTASAGFSAISITSVASTSGSPCVSRPGGPIEDDVDPLGSGVERAEDHLAGRVVSTERVDRDAGHAGTLGSLEAERLDLAALVGAAGRADAVRRASASRTGGTC